ncbi:hypothetical protein AtubIFM57258_003756 [Aspergillus tubingensis]|nr:hypothetical protein AtubIFM57258_003756 [Aspergillus tubingensis]
MKFLSTIIASTLALVVSVQAADCTEGLTYCRNVLEDIDYAKYSKLIPETIAAAGYSRFAARVAPPIPGKSFLFACGPGGSITIAEVCKIGCVKKRAGKSDVCYVY